MSPMRASLGLTDLVTAGSARSVLGSRVGWGVVIGPGVLVGGTVGRGGNVGGRGVGVRVGGSAVGVSAASGRAYALGAPPGPHARSSSAIPLTSSANMRSRCFTGIAPLV